MINIIRVETKEEKGYAKEEGNQIKGQGINVNWKNSVERDTGN